MLLKSTHRADIFDCHKGDAQIPDRVTVPNNYQTFEILQMPFIFS